MALQYSILLAFSGLRIREAVKMLNSFNKNRLMINGNIAKYPLFSKITTKKLTLPICLSNLLQDSGK